MQSNFYRGQNLLALDVFATTNIIQAIVSTTGNLSANGLSRTGLATAAAMVTVHQMQWNSGQELFSGLFGIVDDFNLSFDL